MTLDKFFRWVWWVNGLLFFFAALAILWILFTEMSRDFRRDSNEPVVINIAEDPDGAEKWELGTPTKINGTEYVYIPLVSENKKIKFEAQEDPKLYAYDGSYDSSNRKNSSKKNLLFINQQSNEMRWLFEGVEQLITSSEQLPERWDPSYTGQKNVTELILYTVKTKDTNNDGIVNKDDKSSIAYSLSDGSDYQVLIEDYDIVLSTSLLNENILSVIYQRSGTGYIAKFSIQPFVQMSVVELPTIEK